MVNHLPHFQPKPVCYPYLKIPLGLEITSSDVFGEVSWRLTLRASGGSLCRALAGTPGRGEASDDRPGGRGSHPMPSSVQGMVWHGMVLRF